MIGSSAATDMSVSSSERSPSHSTPPSSPRYHSQSRAGVWRNKKKAFIKRSHPTHSELLRASRRDSRLKSTPTPSRVENRHIPSEQVDQQADYVDTVIADQSADSYGLPPPPKDHNTLRLVLNNVRGLGLFTDGGEKVGRIETTRKKFQADLYCCIENWVQWDMCLSNQQFEDVFGVGEERYSSVGFNRNNRLCGKDGRSQPGGTSILATGRTSGFASKRGMDKDNLGLWCYLRLGTEQHATWVVCAYNPPSSSRYLRRNSKHRSYTVYTQRRQHLRQQGIFIDPCQYFRQQLIKQLLEWKQKGDNIILMGDFNEDVYDGSLAQRLSEDDLLMTCQFQQINDECLPNSHETGQKPLMAVFATAGIDCINAYAAAHGSHVGDHRLLVYDFHAPSILGTHLPHMPRPPGRGVRCKIPRLRNNYIKSLTALNQRNNMLPRLQSISSSTSLSREEQLFLLNRWDVQETELQRCAERRCTTGGNRNIAFCEEVSVLLRKIRCLDRVIRFIQGKVPDGRNLFKLCRAIDVLEPRDTTIEAAQKERFACLVLLEEIREDAPMLREKMLRQRRVAASKRGDDEAVDEIRRIIKKEASKKRFRLLRLKMGKPQSAPLCEVIVPDADFPEFSPHYTERNEVEHETAECIRNRYRLGLRSTLASEPFLSDIGNRGEGPAVQQILDGTYVFPLNTPPEIEALFQEAAILYGQTKNLTFDHHITVPEFQSWWKGCRLDTQSSFSNIHYDHYGCAAYDDALSELQVTKMNLSMSLGWPLERWLHTVIVLLQKEMGTVLVNKLRAICLFEADFNYVLKAIFAKRMMSSLNKAQLLPPEQHAKAHSGATNATMNRLLYQDVHRTLHWPYAVASVDLGDCYDAMYHGWNAISLLAAGVPNCHVKLMLVALQSMGWHLRTGFGLANDSFRGSADRPMMGLGQGSSAAAPAFSVTSLLQTNAYRNLGHCQPMFSAWTGLLLMLAAIIYVDDSDLLLRAKRRRISNEEFFQQVQDAINCWGKIIMATGGHLKQAKCRVSVVSFGYRNGSAFIHSTRQLPSTSFVIPQPTGPSLPIATISSDKACEALGTFVAADGNPSTQLDQMRKKGLTWADRITMSRLHPRDAFLSLNIHLKPRLCWNSVAVCGSPSQVTKSLAKVFYTALPHLRVNRNIRTEFRHLPFKYQGLGIFDVNVERLGAKLHWIQRYWGENCLEGSLLQHAYETFSIDLGLDGNPFTYSFKRYGHLTSSSWWKDLWELVDHFQLRLEVDSSLPFQPYRIGDKSIMRWFAESTRFTPAQLLILNRVRKRKCLFFLSELLMCDGRTIKVSLLDGSEGSARQKTYPYEKPTSQDVDLWRGAIRSLSSDTYHLPTSLGAFIRISPDMEWFRCEQDEFLVRYNRGDDGEIRAYDYFLPLENERTSRRPTYVWQYSALIPPPTMSHLASVFQIDASTVKLQSSTYTPPSTLHPLTIRAVLKQWGNDSLWEHLDIDGDGSWLIQGLLQGTIQGASDGSYMDTLCPDACSNAFMLTCTSTGKRLEGTWAEKSSDASNYRGEIFGGMALALILRAASTFLPNDDKISPVKVWFDNSGVINHGNKPHVDLSEKQKQADVLILLKRYLRSLPFPVLFEKVEAHVDEYKSHMEYTAQERWNIEMDDRAKHALITAIESNSFISAPFPFEYFRSFTNFGKISGSPSEAVYDWHGYNTAKQLFHDRGIVSMEHFDWIYWNGMPKAVKEFPVLFKSWIAKHVSHFCGTNRHLSRLDHTVANVCPSCGQPNESTSHITRCPDPGRIACLTANVEDLCDWMDDNDTDPYLQEIIEKYLLGHGILQMCDIVEASPRYIEFAEIHDTLGWDNFVEGRISERLVELQGQYLRSIDTYVHLSTWASGLMQQLLLLTHHQWMYRNATVHFKADGQPLPRHEQILETVTKLIETDETLLLPEDRDLLHVDFAQLGEGPTIDQERWISNMNTAITAGRICRARRRRPVRTPLSRRRRSSRIRSSQPPINDSNSVASTASPAPVHPSPNVQQSRQYITSYFAPASDTEGSIRYRRRKRRD